ncbi:hypothetical protein FAM09_05810 [Niastella caeni]|uniref:Uncharacterized protein n=1 Tax=Niastella caeni TaxID=2569763 RepID=A0A4S8I4K9_9BACT|nr:hypothetical protein [Niastella caeni]THU41612.1 hypothetical protein FAM09_05810 [Niastella caeni]
MSFNFYHIRTDDFSAYAGGGQREVITRDNYEAYFVMYVDDELNAAERKAVESFIQQNPDLEEELVMLQQSVLRADEHIVFENKESLLKGLNEQEQINEHNYSTFFVLYADDELTDAEKDIVEQFVFQHPEYQSAFELIQQAKLVPDSTITFPDKTYLYRTEEDDNKIVAFPWWRFTAAAIAFLVIGSLAWYISVQNANNKEVASKDASTKPSLKVVTPLQGKEQQIISPDTPETVADSAPVIPELDPDSRTNKEQLVVTDKLIQKNISDASNIQEPSYVKQVSKQQLVKDPENIDIAIKAKPVEVAVDNSNEKIVVKGGILKRTINAPLAVNTIVEETPDIEPDQSHTAVLTTQINKTPLRGFFRKVSRVVDKVTNPEDNGKGGIRIANLEIALK